MNKARIHEHIILFKQMFGGQRKCVLRINVLQRN